MTLDKEIQQEELLTILLLYRVYQLYYNILYC